MTAVKKTDAAGAGGDGQSDAAELKLARQLAERARAEGLSLTGPGGLLGRLTKVVLEGALEGEVECSLIFKPGCSRPNCATNLAVLIGAGIGNLGAGLSALNAGRRQRARWGRLSR